MMSETGPKDVVFNAAKDGDVGRLQNLLGRKGKEEVKLIIHMKTNGATPLIMACKNGHIDVVSYLVQTCEADVELPGAVTFDGESIADAPPLWCAAAAGHLPIVDFLLSSGARVNQTTQTNSTPLRAACFDGHLNIVKCLIERGADIEISNRHGHTCLMISCFKGHESIVRYMLSKGANVNRKSVKGNTALHDCAEAGSLTIMRLLMEAGAKMAKDSYGMTPLLAAAVTGHTAIVQYITRSSDVSRIERIEAVELLGSTYVDKKRDMVGALRHWVEAIKERLAHPPVPVDQSSKVRPPVKAYGFAREAATPQELSEVAASPESMRMQALLVRERILGPAHPDTSYFIRYRGAVYADMGQFERCVELWMYALDMQLELLDPLNHMTQSSMLSFAELFNFMLVPTRGTQAIGVCPDDLLSLIEKACRELERGRTFHAAQATGVAEVAAALKSAHSNNAAVIGSVNQSQSVSSSSHSSAPAPPVCRHDGSIMRLRTIILHLISLMCNLLQQAGNPMSTESPGPVVQVVKEEHLVRFQHVVHRLVYKERMADATILYQREQGLASDASSGHGQSLLHMAVSHETTAVSRYPVCAFPSEHVACLLLELGADPNARDLEGNTPLHAAINSEQDSQASVRIVEALLKAGAHLDMVNKAGKSPLQLLKPESIVTSNMQPFQHITLQCLCARLVKRNERIPYTDILSNDLEDFVNLH